MKIGIVIHRYGREVIGGAENLARNLATRLSATDRVEVLTTCAGDYRDSRNEYAEGVGEEDGVLIRRFQTEKERHWRRFELESRSTGILWRGRLAWRVACSLFGSGGTGQIETGLPQRAKSGSIIGTIPLPGWAEIGPEVNCDDE